MLCQSLCCMKYGLDLSFHSWLKFICITINLYGHHCYRNVLAHKIVGYPIRIDNPRYERNVYLFNLCFVCDSWSKTVQYEPVVKKLGEHLVSSLNHYTHKVGGGHCKFDAWKEPAGVLTVSLNVSLVSVFKSRLYFISKNIWYTNNIKTISRS